MPKNAPAPASTPVSAPAEPTTLPVDEYHGVGGAYELVNGVRRRIAPEPQAAAATDGDNAQPMDLPAL
jgi:hypothetical protein